MPHYTHEVFNQTPLLVDSNLFETDKTLVTSLEREGADWAKGHVSNFGKLMGKAETIQLGIEANDYPPVLRTHDRYGNRIDEVEFHPAWHSLMKISIENAVHSFAWRESRVGSHVARAALAYLISQVETGHLCPISMTYSVIPALRKEPKIAAEWEGKITSNIYDPNFRPVNEKAGAIIGMAMTEKQGGSDVRANTTRAISYGTEGEYLITGHKWFCSAPMSDAFLVLAQTNNGLTCFLLPRWTPDGKRNNFHLQRLKSKLGNRSNASSEVEFREAWARRVGQEGKGVQTIIEMVTHTRLDCVIASSGLMRQALVQAHHHANHRSAFGKKLIDQTLMQNVLADLTIESQAATILMMRLARSFDKRDDQEFEGPFQRIATAISKYWVCKRAVSHIYEALECLGGNGYVEDSNMPRIYREAPLYSIWEGSGNVICLDVLRAASKEPQSLKALMEEICLARGGNIHLDNYIKTLEKELSELNSTNLENQARRLVERLVLALQASLLVRFASQAITDAFCLTRLSKDWGNCFGTLPGSVDIKSILSVI
ncbi:MAG: isovaleryl-CoA dehydrogenase [Acidobacteria bacterium]|nr:isovaleryl-CoA dehydrogenase [Acidobacteriota bacterium]